MTDDRHQVLALDVAPDDAAAFADRVRAFLRDRGFAIPHPDAVDPAAPNHPAKTLSLPADLVGPAFTVRPQWSDRADYNPLWSFIYVHVPDDEDHRIWYLGDSTGPSDCRFCGTQFDQDTFWATFNVWLSTSEPTLTCRNCGKTAPMGDQDTSGSIVVSAVGVVLSGDCWDLVPELLRALRSDFGGRWCWVAYHP